jgi:hypothetical protein
MFGQILSYLTLTKPRMQGNDRGSTYTIQDLPKHNVYISTMYYDEKGWSKGSCKPPPQDTSCFSVLVGVANSSIDCSSHDA